MQSLVRSAAQVVRVSASVPARATPVAIRSFGAGVPHTEGDDIDISQRELHKQMGFPNEANGRGFDMSTPENQAGLSKVFETLNKQKALTDGAEAETTIEQMEMLDWVGKLHPSKQVTLAHDILRYTGQAEEPKVLLKHSRFVPEVLLALGLGFIAVWAVKPFLDRKNTRSRYLAHDWQADLDWDPAARNSVPSHPQANILRRRDGLPEVSPMPQQLNGENINEREMAYELKMARANDGLEN